MNPKVDFYFNKAGKWKEACEQLRIYALDAGGLTEELKWGVPAYTHDKKNVVLIHYFKEYCAVLFVKGALLKDPGNVLIQQTENVRSARQMRFTNLDEVITKEPILKALIKEAIAAEKAGLKVDLKKPSELVFPEEFERVLDESPDIKAAFLALTPGRQRAYILHFSAPKQSKTRESRIEKCIPLIQDGKGLND